MSIRFSLCRLDKEGSASPLSTCSFDAGKRAIRIGRRTRENDVVLRDSENQVSNEHAIIEKCLHGYFVMDLNSTNGTFLDGRALKPNTLYKIEGQSRLMLPGYQLQDFEIALEAEDEKPGQGDVSAAAWSFSELNQMHTAGGGEDALAAAAFRQLSATASALMDEKVAFETEEEINAFCANMRIALTSMITSFQNLDKGRLRVLEDFMALEADAIQDSPLSGMESGQALKRLLDWRNKEEPGALLLDRSLQILIIHELALLKGYQEAAHRGSLRVLGKFEPAAVLAQAKKKKLEIGPLRIPAGALPFAYRAAWKELEKKHAQLMDEDPQTFEALFRPEFAGTYEEITRKAGEVSQNLNQTQRFYVTNMEQMKRKTMKVKNP